MQLTFIGHQSWLLSTGNTKVLIDPIIGNVAGNMLGTSLRIPIYPPRVVKAAEMPSIDAIFLSHEHVDHFDIETYAMLDRRTRVIVGELMLNSIVDAIEQLGFEVTRQPALEEFSVGSFQCMLFSASKNDVWYERRVTQMLFWEKDGSSLFSTVDCLLSPEFERAIGSGHAPKPNMLMVSNNSMFPNDGARRAFYNVNERAHDTRQGISAMREIFDCARLLPSVEHIFLMGNGLLPYGGTYGPFLWADAAEIARMMNELSVGPSVYGPYPGDEFTVGASVNTSRVEWIDFEVNRMKELERVTVDTNNIPPSTELPVLTRSFASDDDAERAVVDVEKELENFAAAFLATSFGQSLQVIDDPQYPNLGARRLVLRLIGGPKGRAVQYALDINEGRFLRDATPKDELVGAFPHGLEMHLCDFHAIFEGRLAPMDLFYAQVRAWFIEDAQAKDDQILAALALVYGEQANQRLAWQINKRAIEQLKA